MPNAMELFAIFSVQLYTLCTEKYDIHNMVSVNHAKLERDQEQPTNASQSILDIEDPGIDPDANSRTTETEPTEYTVD